MGESTWTITQNDPDSSCLSQLTTYHEAATVKPLAVRGQVNDAACFPGFCLANLKQLDQVIPHIPSS
jgi:hypothetical protein